MDLLKAYALSFVGKRYQWGGNNPIEGFDCSGFIQELLASCGVDPKGDQTAQMLFDLFAHDGTWNEWKCGALVFYGDTVTKITHVAMLLDQYRVIEAGGGGRAIVDEAEAARAGAFVRMRLAWYRADLIAVIRPNYVKIGQA